MTDQEPTPEFEPQFSSADAAPTAWAEGRAGLETAEVYWLSTVRPDGRPHVTPIVGVWLDGALYFCTGPSEGKAKNLAQNSHCVITTGSNVLDGLDLVVEGEAARVTDDAQLRRVADRFASKYDEPFRFIVRDGALVFEVNPLKALGFGTGKSFSQTRWRF
jgi:nitroimidazol reductase NimA-like FMN-containing flavoprotein (pyridoxamine 5'-phosphate oxidase superfamily)